MSATQNIRPSPGKPPGARHAAGPRKGRRLLVACASVAFVGVAIAAAAALAMQFGPMSSRLGDAGRAPPGTTASVQIHHGRTCENKLFDNRTGQISDSAAPCPATPVDSYGVPVPLGTVNTINSISRSFK